MQSVDLSPDGGYPDTDFVALDRAKGPQSAAR
jgi:hypothetical protein